MFLRELEGEVLENIALSFLIARYLQRDFQILRPAPTAGWPRRFDSDFEFYLLRGTQRRAQITEFIIDLIGFLDGQTDFFPKQRAVTDPHLMDEPLH